MFPYTEQTKSLKTAKQTDLVVDTQLDLQYKQLFNIINTHLIYLMQLS